MFSHISYLSLVSKHKFTLYQHMRFIFIRYFTRKNISFTYNITCETFYFTYVKFYVGTCILGHEVFT